jgi:inner membrane protein
VYGFAAILGGALSHLAIDTLACPGIPLFAPFSDRKYTVGILPGPSILLAGAALGLVAVTVTQVLAFQQAMTFYAVIVLLYLFVHSPAAPRIIYYLTK